MNITFMFRADVIKYVCILLSCLIIGQLLSIFFSISKLNQALINTKSTYIAHSTYLAQEKTNAKASAILFGTYVPNNLDDALIQKSNLNLEVVGILCANDGQDSQVIIRSASGKEKVYGVGDSLPGDSVIKRITPEGIMVLHNGQLESLSLPNDELLFTPLEKPLIEE